jgi:hypothetical protein
MLVDQGFQTITTAATNRIPIRRRTSFNLLGEPIKVKFHAYSSQEALLSVLH